MEVSTISRTKNQDMAWEVYYLETKPPTATRSWKSLPQKREKTEEGAGNKLLGLFGFKLWQNRCSGPLHRLATFLAGRPQPRSQHPSSPAWPPYRSVSTGGCGSPCPLTFGLPVEMSCLHIWKHCFPELDLLKTKMHHVIRFTTIWNVHKDACWAIQVQKWFAMQIEQ